MSCSNKSLRGGGTVLSKGSSTNANFYALTDWIDASEVKNARGAIEFRGDTGSAQVAPGYQTANDPDSPDQAALLGAQAYLGTEGIQYPTAWTDLTTPLAGKQVVRFGALVKQDADGAIQGAQVSIKIDIQGP